MGRMSSLKNEINLDPLARGYSGMTDEQVASDINNEYRSRIKLVMTGDEIAQSVDGTEYSALTDLEKQILHTFLAKQEINPKEGGFAQKVITDLFGGGSVTTSSLASDRVESISRAKELGLGLVKVGHVTEARL